MKMLAFSGRVTKEILRDPLNLAFGLGFPVVLLLLLSAIQANIPVSVFEISELGPGMTVFGLSFMTLFTATLIAKDRESAFLQRLYATPMGALDFLLGYTLPMLAISLAQCTLCYLVSVILGLAPRLSILWAILLSLPGALLFVGMGLLCGSVLGVKQVGGICGALLTNLTAWLSGIWFDLELIGGVFLAVSKVLPYYHAVKLQQLTYGGQFSQCVPNLLVVLAWCLVILGAAVALFLRQMKKS